MEAYILNKLSQESEEEKGIKEGELINQKIYSSGDSFVINDARLFGKKRGISVRTHTRYTEFPAHKHNYVEMMIVLSGTIKHKIEGEAVTLQPGEILILNKHISHSIEKAEKNDIGVNIIMSDGFIGSVAAELAGTVFSSLVKENQKPDGEPMYLCFKSGGRKYIDNVIENLLFELTSEQPKISVMTKTVSLLLNYLSIEHTELLISGSLSHDKDTKRRMEIIAYVKNNFRTASLDELSEQLYLTAPHLSKITKEYFGKNFKELVVEERMERAKELFTESSVPVGDVIRSVGYENESYFHREFKKRYGSTPLEFRRKNKTP